jgi:hypothetical protein
MNLHAAGTAEQMVLDLIHRAYGFSLREPPQADDITAMALRYRG